MMVLKSPREIDRMRRAGVVVGQALELAKAAIKPGVSTLELDAIAANHYRECGAESLFLGVRNGVAGCLPFPAVTCISINEELVHGIPNDRKLKNGDLVTIDTGCRLDKWCGDSAITVGVGDISPKAQELLDTTKAALDLAIELLATCKNWSQVAREMAKLIHSHKFSIISSLSGHGIGKSLHEQPIVPNHVTPELLKRDILIEPGLVVAIEPMVAVRREELVPSADMWTMKTRDGSLSCHFEHTVAITSNGVQVLTLP